MVEIERETTQATYLLLYERDGRLFYTPRTPYEFLMAVKKEGLVKKILAEAPEKRLQEVSKRVFLPFIYYLTDATFERIKNAYGFKSRQLVQQTIKTGMVFFYEHASPSTRDLFSQEGILVGKPRAQHRVWSQKPIYQPGESLTRKIALGIANSRNNEEVQEWLGHLTAYSCWELVRRGHLSFTSSLMRDAGLNLGRASTRLVVEYLKRNGIPVVGIKISKGQEKRRQFPIASRDRERAMIVLQQGPTLAQYRKIGKYKVPRALGETEVIQF